jgi:hypothetical protein
MRIRGEFVGVRDVRFTSSHVKLEKVSDEIPREILQNLPPNLHLHLENIVYLSYQVVRKVPFTTPSKPLEVYKQTFRSHNPSCPKGYKLELDKY